MTVLGIIFVCAYATSVFFGRKGVLVVLAASMAFNDSIVLAVGGATVTPFYFGLFIYLALSLLGKSRRDADAPRTKRWPLFAFLAVTVFTSIVAPIVFDGLEVVAPGIGIDEQVGALSSLGFTLSSLAQIIYVTLNVAFVLYTERDRLLAERHIAIGFGVGIIVALWGFAGWKLGLHFPNAIFDNSPRANYAEAVIRLRSQFAEPSHLGAFATTAAAFFGAYAFRARRARAVILRVLFFVAAVVLVISAASGTAVIGIAASMLALIVLGLFMAIARIGTLRIRPAIFIIAVLGVLGLVFFLPTFINTTTSILASKVGGVSLESRTYVNNRALEIFMETRWIGVGLGNNRASSLALMLLSTIGIVGCILLLIILAQAFWRGLHDPARRATAIGLFVFIVVACVSLADFASPILWLSLALCYPLASRREDGSPLDHTRKSLVTHVT